MGDYFFVAMTALSHLGPYALRRSVYKASHYPTQGRMMVSEVSGK